MSEQKGDLGGDFNQSALEPGHVLTKAELPEGQKHLVGWLYFADNSDGTMRLAKVAEEDDATGSYHELERRLEALQASGHQKPRIGRREDWKALLTSGYADKAKLDMSGERPKGRYWQHSISQDFANVRYPGKPDDDGSHSIFKSSDHDFFTGTNKSFGAGFVFFQDVPKFQPT